MFFLLFLGDWVGIWDEFVGVRGIGYLGVGVGLDGIVGISWCVVRIDGKFCE